MSYNAEPKDWYRVDKFLHKVPFDQVADVYNQCDILLKTSYLESFSYPPLEMMATGGYAVVVPNDGNKEYLLDGENCLLYPLGKIEEGIAAIERICTDKGYRSICMKVVSKLHSQETGRVSVKNRSFIRRLIKAKERL